MSVSYWGWYIDANGNADVSRGYWDGAIKQKWGYEVTSTCECVEERKCPRFHKWRVQKCLGCWPDGGRLAINHIFGVGLRCRECIKGNGWPEDQLQRLPEGWY
jgi:hypothetical protein